MSFNMFAHQYFLHYAVFAPAAGVSDDRGLKLWAYPWGVLEQSAKLKGRLMELES